MSIITAVEREQLRADLCRLLDQYNYDSTPFALDCIIDEWAKNKSHLIEMFKKHPNYADGKFMIAFDADFSRAVNVRAIDKFIEWMYDNVSRGRHSEEPEWLTAQVRELLDKEHSRWNETWVTDRARENFFEYWIWRQQFITAESAACLNRVSDKFKFKEGMKTSRAMNRICKWMGIDRHADFQKEFAKFADAVNPLKVTRHTILSLNPLDYLTMSFGNSWSSCHTIDKQNLRKMPHGYEGVYSSGTMSYMLDPSTFVFYTVDSNFTGSEYSLEPKINRQMYHFGDYKLVQGRLYPQTCDCGANDTYTDMRNIVQKVVADCMNEPNLWDLKRGCDEINKYVKSTGTHYRDYDNFENCTISILQRYKDSCTTRITIGHYPICVECGEEHREQNIINCCSGQHGPSHTCPHCGSVEYEENMRFMDGEWYCAHCVSFCNECGRYHLNEDMTEATGWGMVCKQCYAQGSHCEMCGQWTPERRITQTIGKRVCLNCLNTHYFCCDRCFQYHPRADRHVRGWNEVCSACNEVMRQEEELLAAERAERLRQASEVLQNVQVTANPSTWVRFNPMTTIIANYTDNVED